MRLPLMIPLLALLAAPAYATSVTYSVAVDTSRLAGTTGSLDFNFDPGPFATRFASVEVTNFGGDGLAAGPFTLTGDASGAPPGTILLDNGTGFNDSFGAFTFGRALFFDVVLSGPALTPAVGGNASGSIFAFSLFSDAGGTVPALTSDTGDGYAVTAEINADGSTTLHNYTVSVTPEPGAGILTATGLLCAAGLARRRGPLARSGRVRG